MLHNQSVSALAYKDLCILCINSTRGFFSGVGREGRAYEFFAAINYYTIVSGRTW